MIILATIQKVDQLLKYSLSTLTNLYKTNMEEIEFYFKDLEKNLKSVEKKLKSEIFFIPVKSDLRDLTTSVINMYDLLRERYIDITKEFKSYNKQYQALQNHFKLKKDSPEQKIYKAAAAYKNFILTLGDEVERTIEKLDGLYSKSSYIKIDADNFLSNLGGFQKLPRNKGTIQLERYYVNLMKVWRATHLNKRIIEIKNLQKSLKNSINDLSD